MEIGWAIIQGSVLLKVCEPLTSRLRVFAGGQTQ